MNTINAMGSLLKAQTALRSASMVHQAQTGMNNEKQEINMSIKLDKGKSTAAKDSRLSQISTQTQRDGGLYTSSLQTAQKQIAKSEQSQNAGTTTQNNQQNGAADSTSGTQDDVDNSADGNTAVSGEIQSNDITASVQSQAKGGDTAVSQIIGQELDITA